MKIMFRIGAPLLFVLGPMNALFGGGFAGDDNMSKLSFGNVDPNSWLHMAHPFFIWGVVIIVVKSIYDAQRAFLPRRFHWLRLMPEPRSTTVLVEGIPFDQRSDDELRKFFEGMFSEDKVKSAYVVKDTAHLCGLIASQKAAENNLTETVSRWENAGKDEAKKPTMLTYTGYRVDCRAYYGLQIEEFQKHIKEERARIKVEAAFVGGVNGACGFVNFHSRGDAEIAQRLDYTPDAEEWVVSNPPGPESIRWQDLQDPPEHASVETVIGYALVAGLYFAYLPLVIGIAKYAGMINMGPFQSLWSGIAPSLGLTVMVSFLPTILHLIFKSFFSLKDEAWAQYKLQNYYFWFQVTFVILVTAIGGDVSDFARTLATSPFEVFALFGKSMPSATHFYMNFMVLQWVTHSLNLLRYINLTKFLAFRKLFGDEDARKMAEPEDQDYYGMGSRSARWNTNMLVGIIYSTLCPPIALLTFINFAICRLQYGYLIPFAETRKSDLGGAFFVLQLEHMFVGLGIYCVLMIGVLYGRSPSPIPAGICFPTIIYVVWSYKRFKSEFQWEKLPFSELVSGEQVKPRKDAAEYVQSELAES